MARIPHQSAPPAPPYPDASTPYVPKTAPENPLVGVPITPKPLRDARGRLLPGQSANRSGRPRGVAALAKSIQDRIGHDALMEYARRIWANEMPVLDTDGNEMLDEYGEPLLQRGHYSDDQRWQAHVWLAERGYGRPVVAIDMRALIQEDDSRNAASDDFDVDALSSEELFAMSALMRKVLAPKRAPIDVEAEEQNADTYEEVSTGDDAEAGA